MHGCHVVKMASRCISAAQISAIPFPPCVLHLSSRQVVNPIALTLAKHSAVSECACCQWQWICRRLPQSIAILQLCFIRACCILEGKTFTICRFKWLFADQWTMPSPKKLLHAAVICSAPPPCFQCLLSPFHLKQPYNGSANSA